MTCILQSWVVATATNIGTVVKGDHNASTEKFTKCCYDDDSNVESCDNSIGIPSVIKLATTSTIMVVVIVMVIVVVVMGR